MSEGKDNRQEYRLDKAQTIFIEFFSSPNEASRMVVCDSLDISANGFKAEVDVPLNKEAIYQLCVELSDVDEQLFLVGQVKWIKDKPDSRYFIGVEILESADTDVEQWKLHLAKILAPDRLNE